MTDEAMSPLRRRMIEDMTIRLGRSLDTASFEDVRFQLHPAANGAQIPFSMALKSP